MKKIFIHLFITVLFATGFHLFTSFKISMDPVFFEPSIEPQPDPTLKEEAYNILKSKCNSCHKRQNPFKIFSLKNMNRHAKKIHKQVFVYERMPKGNKVKLTKEEYQTLKNWLKSKNIF